MKKLLKIIISVMAMLFVGIAGAWAYFSFQSNQERNAIENQIQQDEALWQQHLAQLPSDNATPKVLETWGKQFDKSAFTVQKIDEKNYQVSHFYKYHYNLVCNGVFVETMFTVENTQVIKKENRRLGACL